MTTMRTQSVDVCPICSGSGPVIYENVRDRVFQVDGTWNIRRCTACGSLWLDPRPVDAELHRAYSRYFTHDDGGSEGEGKTPRDGSRPPSGWWSPSRPGPTDRLPVPRGCIRSTMSSTMSRFVRIVRDVATDDYLARHFGYSRPTAWWSRGVSPLVEWWPGRRLDAEFKVMRLPAVQGGRLLDIGCGDGGAILHLQKRGWSVHGIDFDPGAVEAARRRGIAVDLGDVAERSYPGASFDVVTLNHALEHLVDVRKTLREVLRILRPGGQILIVTPNAASWLSRRYGSDWQGLEPPRHLQIFTPRALCQLVSDAGFSKVTAETTARSANGVARAAWKFRKDGHWDMQSRPSLSERIRMELVQQWEVWMVARNPDAGEELVVVAVKDHKESGT